MTRSVVVRMRRRRSDERVDPWRARIHGAEGEALAERLAAWCETVRDALTWPDMPDGVEDRPADVWEPLLMVADAAQGDWPARARRSAVALVTEASEQGASLGVMLLRDLRTVFGEAERLTTPAVLDGLHKIEGAPWADLRGKPLDASGLAKRLRKYDVASSQWADGDKRPRGYLAADLADPWARYLPPSLPDPVTPVTPATPGARDVTPVTPVTGLRDRGGTQEGDVTPCPCDLLDGEHYPGCPIGGTDR